MDSESTKGPLMLSLTASAQALFAVSESAIISAVVPQLCCNKRRASDNILVLESRVICRSSMDLADVAAGLGISSARKAFNESCKCCTHSYIATIGCWMFSV